jgi:hypothetical protein
VSEGLVWFRHTRNCSAGRTLWQLIPGTELQSMLHTMPANDKEAQPGFNKYLPAIHLHFGAVQNHSTSGNKADPMRISTLFFTSDPRKAQYCQQPLFRPNSGRLGYWKGNHGRLRRPWWDSAYSMATSVSTVDAFHPTTGRLCAGKHRLAVVVQTSPDNAQPVHRIRAKALNSAA